MTRSLSRMKNQWTPKCVPLFFVLVGEQVTDDSYQALLRQHVLFVSLRHILMEILFSVGQHSKWPPIGQKWVWPPIRQTLILWIMASRVSCSSPRLGFSEANHSAEVGTF